MHPRSSVVADHLKFALCVLIALAALGALQRMLGAG